jgi:hypothetical protein
MKKLTYDEKIIKDAIIAAREVQEYIWGELSLEKQNYDPKVWEDVFCKRVYKISQIDFSNPKSRVELRKRILQQAALSICAIKVLDMEEEKNKVNCAGCLHCLSLIHKPLNFETKAGTKIYFCQECIDRNVKPENYL